MNEKILELADKAFQESKESVRVSDQFCLSFTELIVEECSKVILEWKKEPFPFDEETAVELIHKHFGLELPPKNIRVIKI